MTAAGDRRHRTVEGHEEGRGIRPLTIGLTGPIGCGKSTVARWLARWGAIVIDADVLAREVTAPGSPAHDRILDRFGDAVRGPDATLDRAALGRVVFADPVALSDLEAIVHPAVRPRILKALRDATAARPAAVVVEAIKLVEAGYPELLDEVWLVTCSPDEQATRLAERGMTKTDASQRVDAQRGLAERLAPAATRIIDTNGTPPEAEARVQDALADALTAARAARFAKQNTRSV
ncbi:MAG TPA: dephospho-CoA kinase [Candidatus Saccharimonadales bacterium]|nr:dephospho-CoA kinase [Candidatus Saccharimonadales bacterium]